MMAGMRSAQTATSPQAAPDWGARFRWAFLKQATKGPSVWKWRNVRAVGAVAQRSHTGWASHDEHRGTLAAPAPTKYASERGRGGRRACGTKPLAAPGNHGRPWHAQMCSRAWAWRLLTHGCPTLDEPRSWLARTAPCWEDGLEIWELGDALPRRVIGRAQQAEDAKDLVDLRVTREERLPNVAEHTKQTTR